MSPGDEQVSNNSKHAARYICAWSPSATSPRGSKNPSGGWAPSLFKLLKAHRLAGRAARHSRAAGARLLEGAKAAVQQ